MAQTLQIIRQKKLSKSWFPSKPGENLNVPACPIRVDDFPLFSIQKLGAFDLFPIIFIYFHIFSNIFIYFHIFSYIFKSISRPIILHIYISIFLSNLFQLSPSIIQAKHGGHRDARPCSSAPPSLRLRLCGVFWASTAAVVLIMRQVDGDSEGWQN